MVKVCELGIAETHCVDMPGVRRSAEGWAGNESELAGYNRNSRTLLYENRHLEVLCNRNLQLANEDAISPVNEIVGWASPP